MSTPNSSFPINPKDFFIPMPSVSIGELPVEMIVRLKPDLVVDQPMGISVSILALLAELKVKFGLQAAGTLWPVELSLLDARLPWQSNSEDSTQELPPVSGLALPFVNELREILGNGGIEGDRSLPRKLKDEARMRLMLTFPPKTDPSRIVRRIRSVKGVVYVELDRIATGPTLLPRRNLKNPNQSTLGNWQGDSFQASANARWPAQWMKVPYTHPRLNNSITTANDPPILNNIAIFDSGVDSSHPALKTSIDYADLESTIDPYGHGTFIAGLIVGTDCDVALVSSLKVGEVSNTVDGILPTSKAWVSTVFDPVAVRYSDGTRKYRVNAGWYSYALNQIAQVLEDKKLKVRYAERLRQIQVVNLSLGSPTESRTETDDINRLLKQNVVIVAASGNHGGNVLYPARLSGVMAVGAHKYNSDEPWEGTNMNQTIDILAPGVDILSSIPVTQSGMGIPFSGWLSGTSMATAFVTAAVAVLKAKDPSLIGKTLLNKLKATNPPINQSGTEPFPLKWP